MTSFVIWIRILPFFGSHLTFPRATAWGKQFHHLSTTHFSRNCISQAFVWYFYSQQGGAALLASVKMAPPPVRKRAASNPTRSRDRSDRSDPKRAKTPNKATVTKPLSSLGFSVAKRSKYCVGTKILLDDSIYDDAVPQNVKDHLFVYEITSIDDNGKEVTIQYKNQVIKDGGNRFRTYTEGDDPQVSVDFRRFIIVFEYHFLTIFLLFACKVSHSASRAAQGCAPTMV
jgi:hypothetical protein